MRKILLACAAVLVMSALAAVLAGHSSRLRAFVGSVTAGTSGARPAPVIYRPPTVSRSKAVPLVIALHGAGSSPSAFETWTGLDRVAAQHGFVVAYLGSPNPLWKSLSNNQYVSAMITQLTASQNIDPSRVYVVGFSLGGVETYRAGCYLSRQVAAIAAVSQGMPAVSTSRCPVARPVSALSIVGSNDILSVHPSARSVLSADAAANDWRAFDGCSPRPNVSQSGPVLQTVWSNCNDASSVGEYVVQGGTHWWPGAVGSKGADAQYSASQAIWSFLAGHRASSATGVSARLLSVRALKRRVKIVLSLRESSIAAGVSILKGSHSVTKRRLELSKRGQLVILLSVPASAKAGRYRVRLALTDVYGRRLTLARTITIPA